MHDLFFQVVRKLGTDIGKIPMAKALFWAISYTERRKLVEQMGLDSQMSEPGKYARRSGIQKN